MKKNLFVAIIITINIIVFAALGVYLIKRNNTGKENAKVTEENKKGQEEKAKSEVSNFTVALAPSSAVHGYVHVSEVGPIIPSGNPGISLSCLNEALQEDEKNCLVSKEGEMWEEAPGTALAEMNFDIPQDLSDRINNPTVEVKLFCNSAFYLKYLTHYDKWVRSEGGGWFSCSGEKKTITFPIQIIKNRAGIRLVKAEGRAYAMIDKVSLIVNYSIESDKTDPAADSDGDGLTNDQEKTNNTDANNPDTDGDGYLDGSEVKKGFDPLKPAPGDKIVKAETATPAEQSKEEDSRRKVLNDMATMLETGNTVGAASYTVSSGRDIMERKFSEALRMSPDGLKILASTLRQAKLLAEEDNNAQYAGIMTAPTGQKIESPFSMEKEAQDWKVAGL